MDGGMQEEGLREEGGRTQEEKVLRGRLRLNGDIQKLKTEFGPKEK